MIDRESWATEFYCSGAAFEVPVLSGPPPPFQSAADLALEVWGLDAFGGQGWQSCGLTVPTDFFEDNSYGWQVRLPGGGGTFPAGRYRVRLFVTLVQPLQLTTQGYLSTKALENALDRQVMMLNMVKGMQE